MPEDLDVFYVWDDASCAQDMKTRACDLATSGPGARLTDANVQGIRWLRDLGYSQPRIARAYGISVSCVSLIVNRKRRSDVP